MVRADVGTAACAAAEPGDDVSGCASIEPGSGSNIAGGGASASAAAAARFWMIGSMSVMLAVLSGLTRALPPVHDTPGVAKGLRTSLFQPTYATRTG
jgi:hypothetical protein